jgi:hypothetical protein
VAETRVRNVYAAGLHALVKRQDSVSMLVEDMSRNICLFILNIIYFILICDQFTDSSPHKLRS